MDWAPGDLSCCFLAAVFPQVSKTLAAQTATHYISMHIQAFYIDVFSGKT